jgi:precorrin-6A/cobalt-precorrin-6A reductase
VRRLLILGGTREAAELAGRASAALAGRAEVITSLAGRTRRRRELPGRTRVGGFGGADGLAAFLKDEAVDWLIDATHPFARQISEHAEAACDEAGVPRLMLARPAWRPAAGDRWTEVADFADASHRLPGLGCRAFLTTGLGGIEAFSGLPQVWFLVRLFEDPGRPLPLADYAVVVERPPFVVEGELRHLRRHRIDVVVAKMSGGRATEAKLRAARQVGLPVLLIRRPEKAAGERVETVEAALAWLEGRLDERKKGIGG